MTTRLVISALPGEIRAAALVEGQLRDLIIERADRPNRLGDLYLGRVTKVDRAQEAAFVEIGLAQAGYLPLSEGPGRRLSEGDPIVVRVLRESAGGKGLRVTARLQNPPKDLDERIKGRKPPVLLMPGGDPIERLLERTTTDSGEALAVVVDDSALHSRLQSRLSAPLAAGKASLVRYRQAQSLFEREGVEEQIEALLEPFVPLPSGGSLLIEPVTTLTAVDVNSGRARAGGSDDAAYAVNLEAAEALARQLRLRALSGLIVVDFLELQAVTKRKALVAELRKALKADPEPTRVFPMNPSGLVEMTRRRGRPALHELLTEPCGLGGLGRVKDPVTLAYEALRKVPSVAAARPGAAITIEAPGRVVDALSGPLAEARHGIESRLGQPLKMNVSETTAEPLVDALVASR